VSPAGDTPRLAGASAILQFLLDNSLLLVIGAVTALIWANVDTASYERIAHHPAVHFAVNDIGMVFFFALATKEVCEAMMPGGPLASPRQAAVPVFAAMGGMIVPASIYFATAHLLGDVEIYRGWAIPCATDIAFSYLVARMVFPKGHAAIPFLLLLAIADDALGLIVLAVFYPSGAVSLTTLVSWLAPAMLIAWSLRRMGVRSFWQYLALPGLMSWVGLYSGGLHPALALVPVVPFMPHRQSELKLFGRRPPIVLETVHEFENWWRMPVQLILLAFGLVNAGVQVSSVGSVTWIVLASLVIGKPLGISLTTAIAGAAGFPRADGLTANAIFVTGIAAGIGFTVALFFATAAFPPGALQDQAKMGALLSFLAAPIALGLGRYLKLRTSNSEL